MEDQAGGARLGRLRIGVFELAEDLRLADDHRIETRADAKQMAHGGARLMPVKRGGERGGIDAAIARQKARSPGPGARSLTAVTPIISTRLQVEISATSWIAGAASFRRASAATISPSA